MSTQWLEGVKHAEEMGGEIAMQLLTGQYRHDYDSAEFVAGMIDYIHHNRTVLQPLQEQQQ